MGALIVKKNKQPDTKTLAEKKNKSGYSVSEFTKFELPLKLNPVTGKLEIIDTKDSEEPAASCQL